MYARCTYVAKQFHLGAKFPPAIRSIAKRSQQASSPKPDCLMGWRVVNEGGAFRVIVTKELPGSRWLDALLAANCEVHISDTTYILSNEEIIEAMGSKCDGVIGQLTEMWGAELFEALRKAGGKVYANYAVGYNNVDVPEATKRGIAVGNTPGEDMTLRGGLPSSGGPRLCRRVARACTPGEGGADHSAPNLHASCGSSTPRADALFLLNNCVRVPRAGVLTETTAEMACTLMFGAARRLPESEVFTKAGKYEGWLPDLFLGKRLWGGTLGIIGAGRIGAMFAKMVAPGHSMNVLYYDLYKNQALEDFFADFSA